MVECEYGIAGTGWTLALSTTFIVYFKLQAEFGISGWGEVMDLLKGKRSLSVNTIRDDKPP